MNIIFTHLRVKLTNIDKLIVMDLFLYSLLPLENRELFLKITTDTIKLNVLLFQSFIEPK